MKLLITGATGLVGQKLVALLLADGHQINFLTTRKGSINSIANCKGFYWNPKTKEIDSNCIIGVDKIIHLAGASVSKYWSKSYKKEIFSSRVFTTQTLISLLENNPHEVNQIVSASAIGIYKHSFSDVYTEESIEYGETFLTEVVQKWEAEVDHFSKLNINVSKIRIGLVLSDKGGALLTLKKPITVGFGAALATGKQYVSWIHIDDLARLFKHIITNNLYGIYNATAPNPIDNKALTKAIASQLKKPLFLPNIPKWILNLFLGEMNLMVCESQNVSSKKIEDAGFKFLYKDITSALISLLS